MPLGLREPEGSVQVASGSAGGSSAGDCIFCKIVAGDAPAHRVYEDERTLVFMDLFPVSEGHTLLIPKLHCENLYESDPDDLAVLIGHSYRVAHAIRRALAPDGLGVFQLNGAAAGQTVFHYHMHLIPRTEGQPFSRLHGDRQADAAALAAVAERIAAALD